MKKFMRAVIMLTCTLNVFAQDSLNVRQIGFFYNPSSYAFDVAVSGSYAYVADTDGLRVIDISNPAAPTETGFYATSAQYLTCVEVSGGYAYVAADETGLRVIDITDPASPAEVGFCETPGTASGVAISGDYAFVADGLSGLRVISIMNPSAPTEVGFRDTPGSARSVAVSGAYCYVADGVDGLRIINISNPTAPVDVGYCGSPYPAEGVAVSGNYAYLADLNGGLRVISVANPASPTEVGYCATPWPAYDVAVDGNYAYVAASHSGLRVISIDDPSSPTEVGYYVGPDGVGVTLSENFVFVAGAGSLHILQFLGIGLNVTSPNGGEQWPIASSEIVRWVGAQGASYIRLELNRSYPFGSWEVIIDSTENDGQHSWIVSGPSSTHCRVRVSTVTDTLSDISDVDFSIMANLSVIRPNGGEELSVFRLDTIRWNGGGFDHVAIEFNRNHPNGVWDVLTDSTENDGEFIWFVTDPLSNSCRIRISAIEDTLSDVSDGNFSIASSQGYLALVRPSAPSTPFLSWNAGTIECPNVASETFRLKNFGSEAIVVFQPLEPVSSEFSRATNCGGFFALAPGQMSACSLTLAFGPASDGQFRDTLLIQTDAVNQQGGYVRIPLSGTQISTPATPQIVITVSGEDAMLHWNAITESVGGCPVDVVRYLVFYADNTDGPYLYHGWTADTTYTHYGVITYASGMYYQAVCVAGSVDLSRLVEGMTREEAEQAMNDER